MRVVDSSNTVCSETREARESIEASRTSKALNSIEPIKHTDPIEPIDAIDSTVALEQDIQFNSTKEILADYKQGKMVIMLDDEDRENEGDLLIAAECITAENINFMATHGRGLICLTLSEQRCKQLNLSLMVTNSVANNAPFGTRFTVSVEAAKGVSTGISAADRATTVKACIKPDACPADVVQPGHVFPIMAQPGGVLVRAGHTEAGCDLARLAGFGQDSSVLVEILNDDGTMARRDDLVKFAKKHDLKIGTIADLIKYRLQNEQTLEQVLVTKWQTQYGDFEMHCYIDHVTGLAHYALIKGNVASEEAPYVRVHVENKITDLLHYYDKEVTNSVASGWPLDKSIEFIAKRGCGVIVILTSDRNDRDILNIINNKIGLSKKVSEKKDQPLTQYLKPSEKILRRIGIGSQILNNLGITKMQVLSEPIKYYGLSGFNLEVVNYIKYGCENE